MDIKRCYCVGDTVDGQVSRPIMFHKSINKY